jgi:probable phosphoglycerate mutase
MLAAGVRLYFVRHGETDWNLAQRYQGRQDIGLNATGRLQAARNGRALREAIAAGVGTLDYVASPLLRARHTMEIVRRELDLPSDAYRTDARLAEIDYGHWEGQLWRELPQTDPDGFAARKADMWNWRPRGGESYKALSERVAGWLGSVARDTVVVAHGGVMRVLRGLVEGLTPQQMFSLPVPQDRVLVLADGGADWL